MAHVAEEFGEAEKEGEGCPVVFIGSCDDGCMILLLNIYLDDNNATPAAISQIDAISQTKKLFQYISNNFAYYNANFLCPCINS